MVGPGGTPVGPYAYSSKPAILVVVTRLERMYNEQVGLETVSARRGYGGASFGMYRCGMMYKRIDDRLPLTVRVKGAASVEEG